MDDLQAIRRMKSGEIAGLEILIARYQVKAIRAAFFVTHDESLAEDVVQETFIRFFQRVRYFDESRDFRPYFMRSVVNAACNLVERENRSTGFSGDEDTSPLEVLLDRAASVETQVEIAQFKHAMLEALFALSPRQRVVIVQRYYLEMSEQEMAESLEIAPGTIKWLLHAARSRLRNILGVGRSAL